MVAERKCLLSQEPRRYLSRSPAGTALSRGLYRRSGAGSCWFWEPKSNIAGQQGRRQIPLSDLYVEDGKAHLTLSDGELIVAVHLSANQPPSAYEKIRIRAAIDFPLAGVAVALAAAGSTVSSLRIALTGTNSRPFLLAGTDAFVGRPIDEKLLQEIERLVQKQVQPMRTTLASANYRRVTAAALARRLTLESGWFIGSLSPLAAVGSLPASNLFSGNNSRRFQFDLCRGVEEIGHKNHTHRREVISHQRFPNAPKLASTSKVSRLVDAECSQSANVRRLAARFCENCRGYFSALARIAEQVDRYEISDRHSTQLGQL